MKLTALVNTEVKVPFTAIDQVDGTPLSGLLDGDFTKVVIRDDTDESGSVALTITEITGGHYYAAFTPTARGMWLVSATAPDGTVYSCSIDVGIFDTVDRMRKETSNAHEVDINTQEEIAYDDDGVTPIQRWDLTTDGGEPVNTQLGVQIKRGVPKLPRS